MSKNDGGSAFPRKVRSEVAMAPLAIGPLDMTGTDVISTGFPASNVDDGQGMSLRDYFAAKAMQATQSDPAVMIMLGPKPNADKVAEYAYWVADAMLAERAK